MSNEKEYKISVDTRILELLGPNLYTNIYYVLAELIANAYDASARNVYIIAKDNQIIVEDDGNGMSYVEGDISKYLSVAQETRKTNEDSYTNDELRRRKMGRKGVGKLAALSVSDNVFVKTVKNGEKSGFILSRNIPNDNQLLEPISEEDINFEKISANEHGTSIVMQNPHYLLHRSAKAIKRNLLKIFPLVNETFRIHIINNEEEITIADFDKEMITELGGVELIGLEFHSLSNYFINDYLEKPQSENLLKKSNTIFKRIALKNKNNEIKDYNLEIKGWVGFYKSTRGRKTENNTDFPDNFISLFANNKLAEFNIIPVIGRNKLNEVYVVGQLHVDLFEETELPDMALSNRQGYRTDDPRYEIVKQEAIKLLETATKMRVQYSVLSRAEVLEEKDEKNKQREQDFKEQIEKYNKEITDAITGELSNINKDIPTKEIEKIVRKETSKISQAIGVKKKIDSEKKKILISQTEEDKPLADIIYNLLVFNNVPKKDILYTAADDAIARIPEEKKVYDYLRDFFVESISDQKIYVIYVTSQDMRDSWGCLLEVGAGWITKKDYKIFNINTYTPQSPLNDGRPWHNSIKNGNVIRMQQGEFNGFIPRIISICQELGYTNKSTEENEKYLLENYTLVESEA